MKKGFKLIFGIALAMVLFINNNVMAEKGPAEDNSWMNVYDAKIDGAPDHFIYSYDDTEITEVKGFTYDKKSNTLTIENVNNNYRLVTNKMGDDFKLNVVGENSLANITVYGEAWGGCLTITGTGSLTINKNQLREEAIYLGAESTAAKLVVEDTVTLTLYAGKLEDAENKDKLSVISSTISSLSKGKDVITFKNGLDVSKDILTEDFVSYTGKRIAGIVFKGNPEYLVYEKDGVECAFILDDGEYIKVNALIVYDEDSDIYFFDDSMSGDDNDSFDAGELAAAGYTFVENREIYSIEYDSYDVYQDEEGNEYVIISTYTFDDEDNEQEIITVYNITDKKITLANDIEHVVLAPNEEVDPVDLEEALVEEELDENYYNHYLLKNYLVVEATNEGEGTIATGEKNPNTLDNILVYYVGVIISVTGLTYMALKRN